MNDNRDLTTRNFDPILCGDGCCESLKWKCNPEYCYPILAKRVFSCTQLKSTPLQSSPFECTFFADISAPTTVTLTNSEICVLSVESIKFKCLGLRQNSDGTEVPDPITENINFEGITFSSINKGICTGTAPNNVNIYTKYLAENYITNVSTDDLCNQENCENSDGIRLNVNFSTDQYGVYGLEIKVKAKLKNDVSGIGVFTATAVVADPIPNAGAGDTNFLLSELGFGPVHFYGNVCFPINKPCDIYKTFGGKFESPCVNNIKTLQYDSTNNKYNFDAFAILCFCPTETIHVVIEDIMALNGFINHKCDSVTPCAHSCHEHHDQE